MRNFIFPLIAIIVSTKIAYPTFADWKPRVYNAIKWTAPNQGRATIEYTTNQGITLVPIAYHGGVDWNESGEISASNIDRFSEWVRQQLPNNYCGPVVIDYEQPWRKELSQKVLAPERLQEILSVYIQSSGIAQGIRPTAQWGFWGMPLLRHTGDSWQEQGLSMHPLTSQCTALYPDIYDASRGNEQLERTKKHITKVLELAKGQIPVYVFVSPRYGGEGGDRSLFIPDDVFLRKVNAAMQAVWVDENGLQHKIQGLILWDTYNFSPESEWKELDEKHKYYFELLQALVEAWEKTLTEIEVEVGMNDSPICQYGLPEPRNSSDFLSVHLKSGGQLQGERNIETPQMENERIPTGRVPSNRSNE